MPETLRSLLFILVAGLLGSIPLHAQTPPPLPKPPRPQTNPSQAGQNNAQLDSLGSMFNSGTRVSHPGSSPAGTSVQTAQHNAPVIEHLSQPSQLRQTAASFSAPPPAHSAAQHSPAWSTRQENPFYDDVYEGQPDEYFYEDGDHQAYIDAPSTMLDRSLSSRRAAGERSEYGEYDDEELDAGGWTNKLAKPSLTPLFSVGGSLLIVIAAFFLLVILFRKVSPQSSRALPKEAFECLGRFYLTQKHQVQVLRLGNRIVLVSVMPDGVSTLAEITDPDETVAFLGLCRRLDNNSATEMFRKTIAGMSEEELNRPAGRQAGRRNVSPPQRSSGLDVYSDPDESLASLLARGRAYGR